MTELKVAVMLSGRVGDDVLLEVASRLSGGSRGVPLTLMVERPSFSEYAALAAFLDPYDHAYESEMSQTEAIRELVSRLEVPVAASFHSLGRPYFRTGIALAGRLGCDFFVARKSPRWVIGPEAVGVHPVPGASRTRP